LLISSRQFTDFTEWRNLDDTTFHLNDIEQRYFKQEKQAKQVAVSRKLSIAQKYYKIAKPDEFLCLLINTLFLI